MLRLLSLSKFLLSVIYTIRRVVTCLFRAHTVSLPLVRPPSYTQAGTQARTVMEERRDIDMTDPITKFCVSFVTRNVAFAGLQKLNLGKSGEGVSQST